LGNVDSQRFSQPQYPWTELAVCEIKPKKVMKPAGA
jgi:hypothetical protein